MEGRRLEFQRGDPFAILPLAMEAEVVLGEVNLLLGGAEVDGEAAVGQFAGDGALPPALVVVGVHVLAEPEPAVALPGGQGPQLLDVHHLPHRLSALLLGHQGLVLHQEFVLVSLGSAAPHDGDDEPRSAESLILRAHLHHRTRLQVRL